jgi:hypothetical protein
MCEIAVAHSSYVGGKPEAPGLVRRLIGGGARTTSTGERIGWVNAGLYDS